MNGRIAAHRSGVVIFEVEQAFGNCPQYIRERAWRRVENEPPGQPSKNNTLTSAQEEWIASADTFFIASGYRAKGDSATFGMDASHRGGERGFVRVAGKTRLEFPDYAGNNHFNTIGNLLLDPRAGFLFIDFETGSLLQLTGKATIDWNPQAGAKLSGAHLPGARRLVAFDIEEIIELPSALALRWEADAGSMRSLRLTEKIRESADVTSFVFEARDAGSLPSFEAGQHLPIELEIPDLAEPVRRTYSLSGAPGHGRYRISVKREARGLASRHLHDHVEPGAILEARNPAGDFLMSCSECPVVLVSAGVGLTPMVSMLHALAEDDGGRPVWFIHGARDGDHHPLAREVRALAAKQSGIQVHVAYSRPTPEDEHGIDYDSHGRIDAALLASLINDRGTHYFLCGPIRFMADVQTGLERHGVPSGQIHTESFGPTG